MNPAIIRDARLRRPFRPFFLKAKDGRRFPVLEPEHVLVTHWLLVVVNEADSLSHMYPTEIESLEYADEPILIATLELDEPVERAAEIPFPRE